MITLRLGAGQMFRATPPIPVLTKMADWRGVPDDLDKVAVNVDMAQASDDPAKQGQWKYWHHRYNRSRLESFRILTSPGSEEKEARVNSDYRH